MLRLSNSFVSLCEYMDGRATCASFEAPAFLRETTIAAAVIVECQQFRQSREIEANSNGLAKLIPISTQERHSDVRLSEKSRLEI